jgi:hypothetical protein
LSKVDRRRFLKYAGAGAAAVGGAVAAYYLYEMGFARKTEVAAPTVTQTATTVDYPPYADFKYKPYYLCPTDEQTVWFTNMSYDLGGDPLDNTWLIDNNVVSHERDYSTKLPQGEHLVDLQVSDGRQTRVKSATTTVEPDQIYPARPLHLKYKGVNYTVAELTPEWHVHNPSTEEMDEQLDTIHDELGCNAIIMESGADYEDILIESVRLATGKGFDRIYVQPRYINYTIDDTIDRIGGFAKKVTSLTDSSDSVVLSVGHEFGLETAGIIPGDNWWERMGYQLKNSDWQARVNANLPRMFAKLMRTVREKYPQRPIAYSAAIWEVDSVPWSDPAFESICTDAYVMTKFGITDDWMLSHFSQLKRYRKPIHSSEAGCMTFTGAGEWGGAMPLGVWETHPYDEDEQARYIKKYCDMLNRARIDGYFYTVYNDDFDKTYGLYNGMKRKKGFYMYKSYQRFT